MNEKKSESVVRELDMASRRRSAPVHATLARNPLRAELIHVPDPTIRSK